MREAGDEFSPTLPFGAVFVSYLIQTETMRLFSLYILALCFSLTACNSHTPEQETLATPEPRKVAGQYGGTIPCASCEGIVYNLELKEDSTYTSQMVYLGEDVKPYSEAGRYYYINEHVIALQKDTNLPSFIQVEEKRLRMLDGDTQIIQGDLADMYILKEGRAEVPKQESKPATVATTTTLSGKWVLKKLSGRSVSATDFARELPYMDFNQKEKHMSGYDGCNRTGGDYTIEGNTLKFGGLFSTKMACITRRGDEFAAFLNSNTFAYTIANGELTLTGANGKAVFTATK